MERSLTGMVFRNVSEFKLPRPRLFHFVSKSGNRACASPHFETFSGKIEIFKNLSHGPNGAMVLIFIVDIFRNLLVRSISTFRARQHEKTPHRHHWNISRGHLHNCDSRRADLPVDHFLKNYWPGS